MTKEQRELLAILTENKDCLEELLKIAASIKETKEMQMEESDLIAGITWSKFAEDEDGNNYMLADNIICSKKFGKNNDWRESPIRKELNEDLYSKIVSEVGEDAIVPITVDLLSNDGLKDYGTCEDKVSILTYDLYRNNRESIKECYELFWLATPDSTPSGIGSDCVRYVGSGGDVDYANCGWYAGGVRPFCIVKSRNKL